MSNNTIRRAVRCALVTSLAAAAASAMIAQAAEQGTTIQEVVVTGSRIAQPGLTSISPVTAIGAGKWSLDNVLNLDVNGTGWALIALGAGILAGIGALVAAKVETSRHTPPGQPTAA